MQSHIRNSQLKRQNNKIEHFLKKTKSWQLLWIFLAMIVNNNGIVEESGDEDNDIKIIYT